MDARQLPPPDSMQLMQQKSVQQNPVGPMNPIQDEGGKMFHHGADLNGIRLNNENSINNLMEPHAMPDMNGAVEEMEEMQQPRQ